MVKDNLFGTLQTPLKPIHYTGIDTKTIDVIVDAENRTIRANIQPEVMDVISGNVAALKSAYEKLTSLSKEIDEVEKVITNIYNDLNQNIHNLKSDAREMAENIARIEAEYATQADVKQWIDEARIPQAELNTYAKKEEVKAEVARLDSAIALKADIEDVEQFIKDTSESIAEINDSLDTTNLRLDTFATKEELTEVQNKADSNSGSIMTLTSELMDTNKAIEDIKNDYATKTYVAEEISKIDIGGGTGGDIDLEDYYTKSETENKIEEALNSITFITASIDNI